jgi:predicted permease
MRRFLRKLLRRHRLEKDLEAELAFHRELSSAQGNPIPLGHITCLAEESRDLWRFNLVENLWRDLVYGARGLVQNPTLLFTAVLSLALGIGANAAIFSLAVELLFSEPSVTDAGSLVYARLGGNSHAQRSVLEFVKQSGLFLNVAGMNEESFVNWNNGSETRPIFSVFATKNFFTVLGVPVERGRGILPDDPDNVVVLNHGFWSTHFNSDPGILGRSINLDGRLCTVIGILPAGNRTVTGFGYTPDVYLPSYLSDTALAMYARLKPGMSRGEALAGLRTVAARLDAAAPAEFKYTDYISLAPIAGFARISGDQDVLTIGLFFAILLAVAGLVLLTACVNVAGLLLARASARRREIAIRLALGAGKGRLLQQVLVESLLLSVLGAGCGLALSQQLAVLLDRLRLPLPVPIHLHIQPDWRLAIYASLLTLASTLICGLLPALRAWRESIAPGLQRNPGTRLRRTLLTAQIAISLIVLSLGFLFLRNLSRATSLNPGFDVSNTLRAEVHLPPQNYKEGAKIVRFVERALADLRTLPGVVGAGAGRIIPFTDQTRMGGRIVFADTGQQRPVLYHWNAITPGFFSAMGIPIRQGRDFTTSDQGDARVAVINQAFADRYFDGRTPVGTSFSRTAGGGAYTVVGVVAGTKNVTIGEDDQPQLYEPLAQIANDRPRIQFVLRSATPPATQLAVVRDALRHIEPAAGLEVATMCSSIGIAFLPSQVGAALMGSIGVLGLLLAAVGLYGTMVYSVTRRTKEIGVRMAMGARPADISKMILLDSAKLMGIGCLIGLGIAFFAVRPVAPFLVPGLKPADPVNFLAVVVLLAATGLISSWGPVRRAASIDPASCLREE